MSNARAMGALRAFSEAFKLLYANLKPMISIILLLLVPCDLMSSLAEQYLPPLLSLDPKLFLDEVVIADEAFPIPTNKIEIHLVSIIISSLSMVIKVYLTIIACSGGKPTLEALSRRARKAWWRPAITVLFATLLGYLPASVFFVIYSKILSPLVGMNYVPFWIWFSINIILLFGMLASVAVLDLVKKWGLVASVKEKGCYGIKAFGKAWGFMKGRKLQVLVLTIAMLPLEMGISRVCAFGKVDRWEDVTVAMIVAKSLVGALVCNLGSIYEWLVHAALYCHTKDRE